MLLKNSKDNAHYYFNSMHTIALLGVPVNFI
jgi:hypothetical protein